MAKEHVHGVFQSVASQYDAANDRISLGMHHLWKKALVDAALASCPADGVGRVLDVCCGTGDITERIAKGSGHVVAVGLDFSANMLDVARERTAGMDNVMLVEGNAMELPFDNDTFDACVVSFGLRNTPDYEQVVGEMARVTRPGGLVACLDASVPDSELIEPFWKLYYKECMPVLGGGISKRHEYEWLYQSTMEFLRKDELIELFRRCGLVGVNCQPFMMGSAALHTGMVPVTPRA